MSEKAEPVIGFVGLGVMGGPMCRNVALKHRGDVITFDMNSAAFAALDGTKARRAKSVAEVAAQADIVFLSLPGAPQVEQVCLGARGLAGAVAAAVGRRGFEHDYRGGRALGGRRPVIERHRVRRRTGRSDPGGGAAR